jgi:hypothetical protein
MHRQLELPAGAPQDVYRKLGGLDARHRFELSEDLLLAGI